MIWFAIFMQRFWLVGLDIRRPTLKEVLKVLTEVLTLITASFESKPVMFFVDWRDGLT